MKTLKFLLFWSLFLFSSFILSAQTEKNDYKAKEGWLATKSDFDGYELALVTLLGTTDNETSFNFVTGTSETWMYLYRNIQDKTKQTLVIVVRDGDNYLSVPFSDEENVSDEILKLDDVEWIDSDVFVKQMQKNQKYIDFMNEYKNDVFSFTITLMYLLDSDSEELPPQLINRHVWRFSTDLGFECFTDAITGDTYCDDAATGIEMISDDDNINIFPQPASDFVNISFPENTTIYNLEVFDLFGELLFTRNINNSLQNLTLPVNNLAQGTYLLKLNTHKGIITQKIIVIK